MVGVFLLNFKGILSEVQSMNFLMPWFADNYDDREFHKFRVLPR